MSTRIFMPFKILPLDGDAAHAAKGEGLVTVGIGPSTTTIQLASIIATSPTCVVSSGDATNVTSTTKTVTVPVKVPRRRKGRR
jgi:hypothetical protein